MMSGSERVPAARENDLVTTETKDEVLVYDRASHHIHHLNPVAATVWRLCDGQRTVADIAVEAGIEDENVRLALTKLQDTGLLEGPLGPTMRSSQSRRTFMKKAGIAAIPAIVSVTAPIAKAAASDDEPVTTCADYSETCSSTISCCIGTCAMGSRDTGVCVW